MVHDYFGPAELATLSCAFRQALDALSSIGFDPGDRNIRRLAACAIIGVAQSGELRPDVLRDAAVRAAYGTDPVLRTVGSGL